MPAARRRTPVRSSNAACSRSLNSPSVVSDVSSRGLRPRSAASANLIWASRSRRASAHVRPNTSSQMPRSSGRAASDTTNPTSNGEVRTTLVNGIGRPGNVGALLDPLPPVEPRDVPPPPPTPPGAEGDGDEAGVWGTDGGETVTGRLGVGTGTGTVGEGRIEGTLAEIGSPVVGRANGVGEGNPATVRSGADWAVKTDAARAAQAAATPIAATRNSIFSTKRPRRSCTRVFIR